MTFTLAVLLGLGVATGIGTGTTALVLGDKHLAQLQAAVDQDLKEIEASVTALQASLTSLSEVVLQNKRGLDLLFMKEGGLCAALKEECCFYADHSGVVKESMNKLREHLEEREKERIGATTFSSMWEDLSPYIAPLLGPLAALLLLLTVGLCVFQRIITLINNINNKVDTFMAKPIQVYYHRLEMAEQQTYRENSPTDGPHDAVAQTP